MKLLTFKRKNTVPPGDGYFWVHEETKTEFKAPYRAELLQKIETFLKVNRHPVPENLDALVEDYMCRHLPFGFCNGGEKAEETQCLLSWKMVRDGTEILTQLWKQGDKALVSTATLERRALQCASCPMNQPAVACLSCYGVLDWLSTTFRSRPRSQQENRLHVCTACCCLLKAKVVLTDSILNRTSDYPYFAGDDKHPACWMIALKQRVKDLNGQTENQT